MCRPILKAVAVAISVCSFPGGLGAQLVRASEPNPALWQSTPDAVALGSVARGFVGLGFGSFAGSWFGSAGIRWGGGMLRASYGQSSDSQGPTYRDYALGYARRLVERDGSIFGTLGAGADVTAAYQSGPAWTENPRGARLALPLSVRWGSLSRLSFSPYVAPYTEYGHAAVVSFSNCPTQSCPFLSMLRPASTQSTGIGIGGDLTLWRLGLIVGVMGVPQGLRKYMHADESASAAVSFRF